jgi:hypothetical protein
MSQWRVYGYVPVDVVMVVEAEDAESAIAAAYEQFPGLSNYAGNGSTDQLVGVHDRSVSLDAGYGEPNFSEADPA